MFGATSDFTIYNDALLASAILVKGTNSNVLIGTTTDANFKLDVNGTGRFSGNANNGTPFLTLNATSANNTFNWVSTAFASNLAVDNNLIHFIGQSGSTKNSAYLGFKYKGSGSNNNILTLGLYAVDNVLNINGLGNVGIGTESPAGKLHTSTTTAGNSIGVLLANPNQSGSTDSVSINFGLGRTVDSFLRSDAVITFGKEQQWTGTPSTVKGYLAFSTVLNETIVERMRITSGGDVLIGTTTNPGAGNYKLAIEQSGFDGIYISVNQQAGGHALRANRNGDGDVIFISRSGTNVGSISVSGSTTSYNTSSDYRLKQDLKDYSGLSLIDKIKTYDYQWKSDNTRMHGVLAHELQEIIPYAVNGDKDGKQMQGVDYSKLVPVLVKAIQEQQAQIEELKLLIK